MSDVFGTLISGKGRSIDRRCKAKNVIFTPLVSSNSQRNLKMTGQKRIQKRASILDNSTCIKENCNYYK